MAVPEGYTEVGLIGLVNKGNYDPLTEYSKYNFVYYQGSTYLYINELPQSGVIPSDDGVTWQYMSRGMIMDNTPTQGSPNAVTSGGIYDSERALKTEIQNEQTAATTKATDTNNVLGQGTVINATNVQALLDNVTDKDTNPTKDSAKTVTSGGVYSADKATREMIAPVEENATSSAPYAIGEQLIFNGVLCEATSAISIGDTLAMGTNLSTANKITNRDSTPTANSTKLVTSGGVYSADKATREMIAPVEENATSSAPYAIGEQLIFNGVLCEATSAISIGDTLAMGTNLSTANKITNRDSTPTANSTKLVTSGGVYSADNQIRENIANVEGATSSHPYTVGKQLIFNGLLCKATSAISVGDTLAVGTNLALSDNVVEQIYSLNQGLANSLQILNNKVDKENLTTCKIQQLTSGTKFDISATDSDRQYGFYYNYGTNQIGAGYKNNDASWNLSNIKLPPFVGETFNINSGCIAYRTSSDGIMIIVNIPWVEKNKSYRVNFNEITLREFGTTSIINILEEMTSSSINGVRPGQILVTVHATNIPTNNTLFVGGYSYINADFTRIS